MVVTSTPIGRSGVAQLDNVKQMVSFGVNLSIVPRFGDYRLFFSKYLSHNGLRF